MKHYLLSLLALTCAMFVSTSAGAWDEPVPPTRPAAPAFTGGFATPTSGNTYYILNVGAGQFLGAGQEWGTRAVTTTQGMVTLDGARTSLATNNSHILPFTIESATPTDPLWVADFFYIRCQNTDKADTGNYLVHEDNSAWVDGWTNADNNRVEADNNGYWEIRENNGAYYLVPLNEPIFPEEGGSYEALLGVHSTNMTNTYSYTWTDAPAVGNYFVEWQFIDASQYEAVQEYIEGPYAAFLANELPAYEAALEGYKAKSDLLLALQEAEEAGVNTDAAAAVYNNPNATVEEVKNAAAELRAAIKAAEYDFSGASEDQPIDVTDQVLTNPNFDGNIDGWTITVGGQNLQYQGRTDGTVDESKNWVQISGFIEAWTPSSGALRDGTISQTVYGLPKGKYMLECDAMATLQGGSPSPEEAVTGAYIFIEGANNETREPIKAPDYQPKHWSVVFVNDGSPWLTFGLKVENTTANWISADNFRLWYYGTTNQIAEYLVLENTIREAEEIDVTVTMASAEAKSAFTQALDAAKAALANSPTDAEALSAANTALKEALNAMRQSISDYQKVGELIEKIKNMASRVESQWPDLSEDLYTWAEDLEEKFQSGTLSNDEVAGIEEGIQQKIRDYISDPEKVKAGDDLTLLIVNPDFDSSVDGWTVTGAKPAVNYNEAECYMAVFDLSQTLKNMPKGAYTIGLNAFTRVQPGGNRMAFRDGDDTPSRFYLYGGASEVPIMRIQDDGHETPLKGPIDEETGEIDLNYDYSTDANGYDFSYEYLDEQGNTQVRYVPNDMDGAQRMFQAGHYRREVTVLLTETGDLTFGVKTASAEDWNLWDNFTLTYAGYENAAIYFNEIDRLVNELQALGENVNTFLTAEAQRLIETLPAKAETVKGNSDADECMAFVTELSDAVAYINKGTDLSTELIDAVAFYDSRMQEYPSSDTEYPTLLTTVSDALENPASVPDNAQLKAWREQLENGWASYIMADAAGASAENPIDVTPIIYNNDYMLNGTNQTTGWTSEPGAGLVGDQIEYFNTNFNIYQELKSLKAGYYRVTVDGFYRAGGFADAAQAQRDSIDARNAKMYVVTNDSAFQPFHSIFDGAQLKDEEGGGQLTGTDEVEVELKDAEGNIASYWIPNMPGAAYAYLTWGEEEDAKMYTNVIVFQIAEDGQNVTIGARKDINLINNWTIFTNWTLTYYGQEIPEEYVGVNSVSDGATAKTVAVFAIDGRQQGSLRSGLNIVRMSDGSVRKVLVK